MLRARAVFFSFYLFGKGCFVCREARNLVTIKFEPILECHLRNA